MTPEQQLRKSFERELIRLLPKGSYLLQPVETNTVGVPDFYLAYRRYGRGEPRSLWIETKTTDYKVDKFQVNWHITHNKTGNKTVILTAIQAHQQPQPAQHRATPTPKPRASLYALTATSKMLDYPTLGRYIEKEQPRLVALEDLLHGS